MRRISWALMVSAVLVSVAHAQVQSGWSKIEGLWRVSYADSNRGLVTGEAAIEGGIIKGFFLDSNGNQETFVSEKFSFTGSQLKGSFSPYFEGVSLELSLFGRDRMFGLWQSKGHIKAPGKREGKRVYENPDDPYLFTASGPTTWHRMTPKIENVLVKPLNGLVLDHPKMELRWKTAKIADDLPQITVDLRGQNLPTDYNSRYLDLLNPDKFLSFHSMEGFPKEQMIRLRFFLLDGATPGPKTMAVNGAAFVVPLVFENYKVDGDYRISDWKIDRIGNQEEERRFDNRIADLNRRIARESSVLNARREANELAEADLLAQNSKAQELVKKVISLIKRSEEDSAATTIDQATERALTRRSYIIGRIANLKADVIELAGKAEEFRKAGSKQREKESLDEVVTLQTELDLQEADLVTVEAFLAPYLKSKGSSAASIREQLAVLRGEYATMDRRRESASMLRLKSQKSLEDQQLIVQSLGQSLNAAIAERAAVNHGFGSQIQSVRVANDDTNETVFYSTRTDDPADSLISIDELIDASAESLQLSKDNYLSWRAQFEDYFEEARYRQRLLGGTTGRIMQSASIQAGSEALFFVLDLAEDYKDGGLPLVIGDLLYKTGQAIHGDTLQVDTLDYEQVEALKKALSRDVGGNGVLWSMDELAQFIKGRAVSEAQDLGIKGPFIATFLRAVETGDKKAYATLRADYLKKATRALLSKKSITDFLEEKATPKFLNVVKGAGKAAANERIKNFAKTLEKGAYIDYFRASIVANQCFKVFRHAREEYWRQLDDHNALLRTRVAIKEKQKSFNRETGFQIDKQLEFKSGINLRVSILNFGGLTDETQERVYLNGILLEASPKHRHYCRAAFLTPRNSGDLHLTLRPALRD